MLSIFSGVTNEAKPWISTALLGVIQLGIPYILYSTAIKYVTALNAIIYPIIEPVLNPILVYFVIGEVLGSWVELLSGGVLENRHSP